MGIESRDEPYIFKSPFTLAQKSPTELFEDEFSPLIKHGPLKRLIVKTGQVAETYNSGNLEIIEPSKDGKPILITSGTHAVSDNPFVDKTIRTILFPRRERKPNCPEEDSYIVCPAADSAPVGFVLLVAFYIEDPVLALKSLGSIEGVIHHIEGVATAELGKAVGHAPVTGFDRSSQTVIKGKTPRDLKLPAEPSAPEELNLLDEAGIGLKTELAKYGICFIRMNIEKRKIMDPKIAGKLAEQTFMTTHANAEKSIVETTTFLKEAEARRDAAVLATKQRQENDALIQKTTAELLAEEKKMGILKLRAETDAAIAKIQTDVRTNTVRQEAEAKAFAAEKMGEVYKRHPELLQIEIAKIHATSLAAARPTVFVGAKESGMFTPGFFPVATPVANLSAPEVVEEKKSATPV